MKDILILTTAIIFLTLSCKSYRVNPIQTNQHHSLDHLVEIMSGEFSSSEQAIQDSSFYDISLVMYPIWTTNIESKWLYVEQAVTSNKMKPYRQRIYQLTQVKDGEIESKVYELPHPDNYIHAWEKTTIFNDLTPELLTERQGCTVYLSQTDTECYQGSTHERDCKSTLRGASYATSRVKICPEQVISWDQGWGDNDIQVWGAVKGGYIFKKTQTYVD